MACMCLYAALETGVERVLLFSPSFCVRCCAVEIVRLHSSASLVLMRLRALCQRTFLSFAEFLFIF
jgi:hypothetical protein